MIPRMVASRRWPFDQANRPIVRINGSSRTELNYYSNGSRIIHQ
jgi:hypothetical protein